ncbi:DUF4097 family beta strand repeat-containing protein [Glycomyces xiaoerkulensis]|uniref:DUF4097 family beta strand repeat-containing protein n=1 Tax=Glycomyces xiaoerkulensis TaxID=2038139 RepID=UPI000C26402E|nr:DUF4097 family beta strand repeat-containing protein [Glycomyces xiaoerkulensis]
MTTVRNESPTARPGKSSRRAWWIFGGALTAAVLVMALIAAGAWIWAVSSPNETGTRAETYPQPVAGVDLDVSVGEVNLTAGDGEELEVRSDLTWKGTEPRIEEEMTADGVFEARADCREDFPFQLFGDQCEIDYTLGVPSGTETSVRTDVADINVDGIDGDLSLETEVGDVDARQLRTSATSVESGVGDIVLAFDEMRGDIDVESGVGDLTILVPDDGTTYDVRLDTGVGEQDIDIATDPTSEADYVINATTGVGDLEVRYGD